ncbi:MAG: hypothetical protein IPJ61_14350 [Tessaracoccus sp.]|uniref:hypothetical protein n=1 Tax=Tessaracoccus sp. TaxID=1971211 RepID=UPI001EB1D864|nr:hypothetical protein [Tessaracoccus sp.]MBK7822193.1 hypothetical protein [Tessaracoccus sp.]
MATAYLEVRSLQARDLAASLTAAIDSRIDILTQDVKAGLAENGGLDAAARAELARQEITALVTQRTSLVTLSENAGDIITPAINSRVDRAPRSTVWLAGGFASGLFVGLAGALLRDLRFSRVTSGEQLADLVDLPVWLPERELGPERWNAASELFGFAVEGRGPVVVAAADHPAAAALAQLLVSSQVGNGKNVRLVPVASTADVLASARDAEAVVLVLAPGSHRRDVAYLVTMLAGVGREILGVVLADRSEGLPRRRDDALPEGDRRQGTGASRA